MYAAFDVLHIKVIFFNWNYASNFVVIIIIILWFYGDWAIIYRAAIAIPIII